MTTSPVHASGEVLAGRYQLETPLAVGNDAEIWKGTDTTLGRGVAVKVLRPEGIRDPAKIAAFRHEGRIAARIKHPGVVDIFDTIGDGVHEAIIMELIEGIDLHTYLEQFGDLTANQTIAIGAQVSRALDHCHRQGVIHRDMKPANLMVGNDRVVKIIDFGVAHATGDGGGGPASGATRRYASPEQLQGHITDARTDIWGLGATLYRAVTGTAPFDNNNDPAAAINQRAPAASSLSADIPRRLDAVLSTSLERNPNDRYRNANDLTTALVSAASEQQATGQKKVNVLIPAVVLAALLLILALLLF